MAYDAAAKKVSEFIVEDSFGSLPTNPDFENFGGLVTKTSVKKTMVPVKIPYLKDDDDTDRLQSTKTEKVSEAFAATVTLKPIDFSMLPYILRGATASTYAIGDTAYDIGLGVIVGSNYEVLGGGCFNKYECTIASESAAEATVECMFAKSSGVSGSDYVTGTGTHASTPAGNVLKFGDLTTVLYDAATTAVNNITIDNLKFGIEYTVNPIKDLGSSNESGTAAWSYEQRNINLELNATFDDMTIAGDHLDGAAHTFGFIAAGKTFAFSNIFWDGDWDEDLSPDDLIAMPLKASNVDLTIT